MHLIVGLATLLVLGSVGLVAMTAGAKWLGIVPAKDEQAGSDDGRWDRIEAQLQQNEQAWQEAALEELRLITEVYYSQGEPITFQRCTVLGRTEDGKHLIAEAVWHFAFVPASTAPRISTLALIHDKGMNKPEVVARGSCPLTPSLTSSRVQDLMRHVPDSRWTLGNL